MTDGTFVGGDWNNTVAGFTYGTRLDASSAGLANGGWVTTWSETIWPNTGGLDDPEIYAQIYDANGNPVGSNILINTTQLGAQVKPKVVGIDNGNFVISWVSADQDGDGWGIYSQTFDSSGIPVGTETLINTTTTGDQFEHNSISLDNGGYAMAWAEEVDNGGGSFTISIKMQQYTSAGVPDGVETTIKTEVPPK